MESFEMDQVTGLYTKKGLLAILADRFIHTSPPLPTTSGTAAPPQMPPIP